jgi:glycosyltransferase 2 family protein
VQPRVLNPVLAKLGRGKLKGLARSMASDSSGDDPIEPPAPLALTAYPVWGLLGEFGFVVLRSLGFVAIVMAWVPISPSQILPILSGFSGAWLLGLVVPGAPGGIGVFEATALASLGGILPAPILLAAIVGYRLISTIAELLGAGLGVVILRRQNAG